MPATRRVVDDHTSASIHDLIATVFDDDPAELQQMVLRQQSRTGDGITDADKRAAVRAALADMPETAAGVLAARAARPTT